MTRASIEKLFDVLFGIAPPDSLKGKHLRAVKSFLFEQIVGVLGEVEKCVPVERASWMEDTEEYAQGWDSCREEMLLKFKAVADSYKQPHQ